MILLDTNVLSELMKPDPEQRIVDWVDMQIVSTLFICAITRAEIELDIALLPNGKRKRMIEAAALRVFSAFQGRCLPFAETSASQYARIVAARTRLGHAISVEDAQIASVAVTHGLDLATRNTKDFADIPNLILINPWD